MQTEVMDAYIQGYTEDEIMRIFDLTAREVSFILFNSY
jgi:hypothetical protein